VVVALSGVAIWDMTYRADRQLRAELLQQARMIAWSVSPARVAALRGEEADLGSPDYVRLKEQLALVRRANPDCRFLYLMGRRLEGTVFFFVDSEPPGSPDESPPGQAYDEATPQVHAAFTGGQEIVEGPFTDRWGTWVSAFVPLVPQVAGDPRVVLGMDISAANWRRHALARAALPVALVLLVASLGLFLIGLRRANRRILQSQQKLQAIFRGAPVGMGVVVDRVFTEVNDRLCELTGYDRNDLLGRSSRMIFPGDEEFERVGREKYAQIENRGIGTVETRFRRKDGCILDVILSSAAFDRTNLGRGVALAALDITERRRAEEGLRISEERFAKTFRASPDAILLTTVPDGRIVEVNEGMVRISGYTVEEMLGRTTTDLGLWADPSSRDRYMALVRKDGRAVNFETTFRIKSGAVIEGLISGEVLQLRDGPHFLSVVRDVTERKRAEEALRVQTTYLQELFEGAPEAIVVLDKSDVVQRVNREFARLFGYAPHEAVGRKINDLIVPTDRKSEGAEATAQVAAGKHLSFETIRQAKDGRRIHVSVLGNPIGLGPDQLGVYGIYRDITERRNAEDERERLQAQFLQAQKMEAVGRLAGGVAHDFNNMLQVMLGHVGMVLSRLSPADPLRGDLEEARKSALRSADLTRQLLAFARKQVVQPKVVDLNETIEGMLSMLRRLIGEDITLSWKPAGNLWMVQIDPSQVDQMLANLCVNARDAIEGVGEVTIQTENIRLDGESGTDHAGTPLSGYVMLTVSDTGCGMSTEVQAHLFEPFFTTKGIGEGTGLGLATVHGIVKQNGGSIEVHSEVGKGTTIKILLPRHEGEEKNRQQDSQGGAVRGRGEMVLFVEDDEAVLGMGVRMLETLGYRVMSTVSPEEGIRCAEEHGGEIDLLITDVVMPGMNGRELARRMEEVKPGVRSLYISGYTADVMARRGVLEEGVRFLQKPFTMEALARKVREALEG
jgi:PAS domain S-box-containing protein